MGKIWQLHLKVDGHQVAAGDASLAPEERLQVWRRGLGYRSYIEIYTHKPGTISPISGDDLVGEGLCTWTFCIWTLQWWPSCTLANTSDATTSKTRNVHEMTIFDIHRISTVSDVNSPARAERFVFVDSVYYIPWYMFTLHLIVSNVHTVAAAPHESRSRPEIFWSHVAMARQPLWEARGVMMVAAQNPCQARCVLLDWGLTKQLSDQKRLAACNLVFAIGCLMFVYFLQSADGWTVRDVAGLVGQYGSMGRLVVITVYYIPSIYLLLLNLLR